MTLADKLREVEEVRNSVREGRATYVEALAALMQIDLPDPEVDPLDADYTQYFRAEDAEHQRDELAAAAKAYQTLGVCYRLGKQPSEALFKKLDKANAALNRVEEKP